MTPREKYPDKYRAKNELLFLYLTFNICRYNDMLHSLVEQIGQVFFIPTLRSLFIDFIFAIDFLVPTKFKLLSGRLIIPEFFATLGSNKGQRIKRFLIEELNAFKVEGKSSLLILFKDVMRFRFRTNDMKLIYEWVGIVSQFRSSIV